MGGGMVTGCYMPYGSWVVQALGHGRPSGSSRSQPPQSIVHTSIVHASIVHASIVHTSSVHASVVHASIVPSGATYLFWGGSEAL